MTSLAQAPGAVDAIIKDLWVLMDRLPQRDLIQMSDAKQWIEYMANVMPDDAKWHMIRAGGVGGSEIGGLVRNFLGHRADHEFNAHDWAMGKLLRSTPEAAHGVLQRGHDMEPLHAARFYKEMDTRRDEVAFERLSKAKGIRPWMRYSPDEMVNFSKPTTVMTADGIITLQGRVLVDYKAPTTVDKDAKIAFQYSCQLHQGAILCEEQGIELSGTMLSQYDWATWSLKNDFVQIDPDLCELIKQAGDYYWDQVMRGEVPPYIHRKRLNLDPSVRDQWRDPVERLAQLNGMRLAIEKEADALRDRIAAGLQLKEQRLDGQVLTFPSALKFSAVTSIDEDKVRKALGEDGIDKIQIKEKATKYNADAMLEKLKSMGVDVKPFRKIHRLDPSLTFDALVEAGLDPEEFMQESLRVTVEKEMKQMCDDWFVSSFDPVKLPEVPDSSMTAQPESPAAELEAASEKSEQNFRSRPAL